MMVLTANRDVPARVSFEARDMVELKGAVVNCCKLHYLFLGG